MESKGKHVKDHRVRVEYEIEVRDKHGNVIKKLKKKSESLLTNFLQILGRLFGNANQSFYARDGVAYAPTYDHGDYASILAPEGNDDYGVLVGTGTTPVTASDYDLASPITHGTGAGQLQHGAMSYEAPSVSGSVTTWRNSRTFTNGSGADITVNEIGLAILYYGASPMTTFYVLIARDVLATPVTVPDGATLTVRYSFKVTA